MSLSASPSKTQLTQNKRAFKSRAPLHTLAIAPVLHQRRWRAQHSPQSRRTIFSATRWAHVFDTLTNSTSVAAPPARRFSIIRKKPNALGAPTTPGARANEKRELHPMHHLALVKLQPKVVFTKPHPCEFIGRQHQTRRTQWRNSN
jgi:hypothetical protein